MDPALGTEQEGEGRRGRANKGGRLVKREMGERREMIALGADQEGGDELVKKEREWQRGK